MKRQHIREETTFLWSKGHQNLCPIMIMNNEDLLWLSRSLHIQLLINLFVVFLIRIFLRRHFQKRILFDEIGKMKIAWNSALNKFEVWTIIPGYKPRFQTFLFFFSLSHSSNFCFIGNQDFSMSRNWNLEIWNSKFVTIPV